MLAVSLSRVVWKKAIGPVATLLVQDGTLAVGQAIAVGAVPGRVRSMSNDRGELVDKNIAGISRGNHGS